MIGGARVVSSADRSDDCAPSGHYEGWKSWKRSLNALPPLFCRPGGQFDG